MPRIWTVLRPVLLFKYLQLECVNYIHHLTTDKTDLFYSSHQSSWYTPRDDLFLSPMFHQPRTHDIYLLPGAPFEESSYLLA